MVRKTSSALPHRTGRWRGCRLQISLAIALMLAILVIRSVILSESFFKATPGHVAEISTPHDLDPRDSPLVVLPFMVRPPNTTSGMLLHTWEPPATGPVPAVDEKSQPLSTSPTSEAPPMSVAAAAQPQARSWREVAIAASKSKQIESSRPPFVPRCLDPNQPLCFLSDDQLVKWRKTRPPRPPKPPPPPPPPPDPEEEEYEQLPIPARMEWPKERGSLRSAWQQARERSRGRVGVVGQQKMEMSVEWSELVGRAKRNGTRMWERLGMGEGEGVVVPGPRPASELFVGIFSSPLHVKRRQGCRDTWLSGKEVKEGTVMYRFFVGLHRNVSVSESLLAERRRFGDLVLLPLMDSYYIIAFKTLAIAQFAATQVDSLYVMKTDDDAYVRLDAVMRNLTTLNRTAASPPSLLYGNLVRKTAPARSRKSKWFVSYKEWPQRHFPIWAHGAAYIFSQDIARSISASDAEGNLPMFKLEDVGLAIWVDALVHNGMAVDYVNDKSIVFDGCRDNYTVAHYQMPRNMHCLHENLANGSGAKCCNLF